MLEVEKKATLTRKAPEVICDCFFSIVQTNKWRGRPSVVVTEDYSCLERPTTAMMEKKLVVAVAGFPELYFFKFLLISANILYKDFRVLAL